MKKQLFDLTIEEFTRVLLEYPEEIHLPVKTYDEEGKKIKDDEITGTYEEISNHLDEFSLNDPYRKAIERELSIEFDYNMRINDLDIYNYLNHITYQFQQERIKIVLNEMDCIYMMDYCENIDAEVVEKYEDLDLEIPTKEITIPKLGNREEMETRTVTNLAAMREYVYPCREFAYSKAISLLRRKISSQQIKKNHQFKSDIYLSDKKGCRVNFIRIINCLSVLGFFKDENGGDIAKQKVMETFGALLNKDFSTFSNDLSSTKSASNKDGNSLTKIFHEMLSKQKEINGIDQ